MHVKVSLDLLISEDVIVSKAKKYGLCTFILDSRYYNPKVYRLVNDTVILLECGYENMSIVLTNR